LNTSFKNFEVGYDIPAVPGMVAADVQTPCLVVDLDALERNIARMQAFADEMGVRLRVHGKMHKCAELALKQIAAGACGICCQKVSEAESFVRAGIKDVLISNQVCEAAKVDRLARLAGTARMIVCVDDAANIADLSAAAHKHGSTIEVLVEIDCGAGRCGVRYGQPVVDLAKAIVAAAGLTFAGLQGYQGPAQHIYGYRERKATIGEAIRQVRKTVELLKAEGLECAIVGGGGTGSYYFEGKSGVYNELQCGSYAFMDAEYQRVKGEDGRFIFEFENALFILTSVMSHAKLGKAICDAGLKVLSVDSGLPVIFGRNDVTYVKCSDEHGEIADPNGVLRINNKLKLIPGHIDPTCNLHDWYVCVREGKVEMLWSVTARGKAY